MADIAFYAQPRFLYRYRSLSGQLKINDLDRVRIEVELEAIENHQIFCAKFDAMNDPMEGDFKTKSSARLADKMTDKADDVSNRISELGIASMSESHKLEPMWAHYAGNFSGICIKYNVQRLLDGLTLREPPKPQPPLEQPLHVIHELVQMTYTEEAPELRFSKQDLDHRARNFLSNKHLRWSTEREWRLIRGAGPGSANYGSSDASHQGSSKPVVTAVYLGQRIDPVHQGKVKERMSSMDIKVMDMSVGDYKLSFPDDDQRD